MKKILLTSIVVLLAMALNAQVSVWDGSYEMWDTIHAGTEDDPILIENAAQFAYLQRHTKPYKNFKLMTDIDLDNRDWYPIGHSSITYASFMGSVDFNGHTIYHLTTTLFSVLDGSIKNLTIKDSDIVRHYDWNAFGGIANFAYLIENCHNYGNVILNYDGNWIENWSMGGIAGECGEIRNCSYHGELKVITKPKIGLLRIGGIAGEAGIITSSYNSGDMVLESEIKTCIMGGICGELILKAQYCYSSTDLSTECDDSYVGGIVGGVYFSDQDTTFIKSCYFTGNIVADNICGIIANNDYPTVTVMADDSYYINSITSQNDYGTPKSEDEMKSEEFIGLLNVDEEVFFMDTYGYLNDGFPILKWQHESHVGVDETDWQGNVAVYPNPVQSVLTVSGENLKELEVINILGQPVLKTPCSGESVTIDLAGQPAGVYFIKITDKNGNKYSEKVVKE
jgi:hypothetical protein